MDHKELRARVNQALGQDNLLTGLEEREKVTSGLSSGSMVLNFALSGSPLVGYAWGRIAEIYGPESGGKTTLALHAVLEAQRLESQTDEPVPALFIDAEHALDITYAAKIGIDLNNITVAQPDSGEDSLNAVEEGVKNGYRLVVVDSVAALTPRAELEGEMGDSHMGLQARLMSQALRKLRGVVNKTGSVVIFINQIRMKLGLVFGNPETTTGGNALKFYSSYRIEVRAPRGGKKTGKRSLADESMSEAVELGTVVNAHVSKNKTFPPHRTAQFYIEYGVGIDRYRDALDFLIKVGAFNEKTKALFIPSKKKSYQYNALLTLFRKDPDVQRDIVGIIQEIDNKIE